MDLDQLALSENSSADLELQSIQERIYPGLSVISHINCIAHVA